MLYNIIIPPFHGGNTGSNPVRVHQHRVAIIEKLAVARKELHLGTGLNASAAVPVELDFVNPIAGGQLRDSKRHHRICV
jgi:hypothetical protein